MATLIEVLLAIGLSLSNPPEAGHGSKISTIGDWTIYRRVDSMTDERSCVADYKDDASVELGPDDIGFKLANEAGISSYRLRWDENPPSNVLQPTNLERAMSLLLLADDNVKPLLTSKRLRVQIRTLRNRVLDFDVSLSDAPEVVAFLNGPECKKK